jgi:hypothetical protein
MKEEASAPAALITPAKKRIIVTRGISMMKDQVVEERVAVKLVGRTTIIEVLVVAMVQNENTSIALKNFSRKSKMLSSCQLYSRCSPSLFTIAGVLSCMDLT